MHRSAQTNIAQLSAYARSPRPARDFRNMTFSFFAHIRFNWTRYSDAAKMRPVSAFAPTPSGRACACLSVLSEQEADIKSILKKCADQYGICTHSGFVKQLRRNSAGLLLALPSRAW
jgi:hypothetical protein